MATLKDLSRKMHRLSKDLDRRTNDVAKEVATEVLKVLAEETAVDTSQAISNWQVSYNSPNFTNIKPHYPGKRGSTYRRSSAETKYVGNLIIRGKRPGQELHISNGLPYIRKIDIKSSRPGFRRKALLAGRAKLAQVRKKIYVR